MTIVRRRVVLSVLYGLLALLLLLVVTGALGVLLPGAVATRLGYNSEGYLFALVLGLWIQVALPRIPPASRMPWALAVGVVWALVGAAMLVFEVSAKIKTLNEPSFALALLIPWVTLKRPVHRWTLAVVPVLILVTCWAVGWAPESWVIDQAETFGFVVLAIVTLDVADRMLLEPDAAVVRWRWAWYAFMVLEPVVVSLIGTSARRGGGPGALALEYLGRIHESFVGVLLVAFVLHLGRWIRRP